jgi:lipopolysaccharide/colanic/teichoic acid biosynthesis glycosyltransferase/glycosyltransferase involved in cell wall biosynthesis
MNLLFVTQYFPPETGAAPARALHFARALARAGHDVRVVTGLPNHPSGSVQPAYAKVRRATEHLDGITVERVWLYATPRKTALTRLWNHLSFALGVLPVALTGPRPSVVIATTPPPFLGLSAWLAARLRGAPFVLDCRDDWPRAAIALGELRPGLVTSLLSAVARFQHARAARVIAVTPGMKRQFESRGLDPGRIALITNGADTDTFTPGPSRNGGGTPLTVLYAGTHGLVHGMEALVDAIERLRDRDDLRWVLVGDGVAKDAIAQRIEAGGLQHVTLRPSEPPAALVGSIRDADVCVATTRAHVFSGETIPVKIFDYLACGRPVVAAVSGDAAEIVEGSGGGIVVTPGDGEALAGAVTRLAADPALRERLGAAGPPFVARQYSRKASGEQLVALVREVHLAAHGRDITPRPAGVYRAVKRLGDIAVAGLMLLLLLPLLIVVATAIRLDSPGPALFRQRRIGRGTSEFTIFKFRTMQTGTPDLASHLVGPGSSRVTRLGRFLRRTSIDELPQLLNVLSGSMTLVGPRPALFNQYDLIAMRQAVGVDALKPGVTGWAQINGRDEIPMTRKVELDREYLECVSPLFDLRIFLRTAGTLFSDRGVY